MQKQHEEHTELVAAAMAAAARDLEKIAGDVRTIEQKARNGDWDKAGSDRLAGAAAAATVAAARMGSVALFGKWVEKVEQHEALLKHIRTVQKPIPENPTGEQVAEALLASAAVAAGLGRAAAEAPKVKAH